MKIPFNKVFIDGKEEEYVIQALRSGRHCGNHDFNTKVINLMKSNFGFKDVFLTPSGTSALEMGVLLANLKPGDEVILPSYTFSSTANAFVLFGAIPVFCEIYPTTMNIDVSKIEPLITSKTKMILPIDYAGVPCEIDKIMEIADRYNLIVLHDCAQSYGSYHNNKACGSQAHMAAFSFHETKNFNSGEGGALVVNIPEWHERAYFLQEKGTDRRLVLNGVKNKYSWVDKGSSYLLSNILAAVLLAQIENEEKIKSIRSKITNAYLTLFDPYHERGHVNFLNFSDNQKINHHAFWVLFDTPSNKDKFMASLREFDIHAYIGYLPLHSSPMGGQFGYKSEDLPITEDLAMRLVRLPFYTDLYENGLDYCIYNMSDVLKLIYQ
jgi:dTDP-4-amino-4,6-dideoxygalactose transaminase